MGADNYLTPMLHDLPTALSDGFSQFFNLGFFATEITQIVETGTSHLAPGHDLDLVDDR